MTSPSDAPGTVALRDASLHAGVLAGRDVVRAEARAVAALDARLGPDFARAVEFVASCRGRVVVTGLGKSGRVGRKIAATLASTGSPALFVHATEALHGDAGMVHADDVVIAISNSGETAEVCTFCRMLAERGIPLVAMTGASDSSLARRADVVLDIAVEREADPFGLVPTASTTATAAMGDALAIAAMVHNGFQIDDFHRNHPGGSLGSLLRETAAAATPAATADVCVVGSFMLDLVVSTDRRPGVGETVFGESFETFLGGKGFNQAVAAARAGAPVAMVGRLGTDEFGDRFRASLASEGINALFVIGDADVGTGVGCPVVGSDGSNAIIVVPRANMGVTPSDIEAADDAIRSAQVLLIQLELPVDALATAARIARDAGTLVVLNPAPARDDVDELRGLVDVIVPNEVEAEQLTGISCADGGSAAAAALLEAWDASIVVITLGDRGAYFATGGTQGSVAAHAVTVVDTVGAGDAFVGCLVAGLARGDSLEQAVRTANAAGALAVTKPGAEPSMPHASDVAALLAASDGQGSPR